MAPSKGSSPDQRRANTPLAHNLAEQLHEDQGDAPGVYRLAHQGVPMRRRAGNKAR